MRKFLLGAMILACAATVHGGSAQAPFAVTAQVQKSGSSQAVLQLNIADSQDKSGVCSYYLKSFQYLEAIKTLDVEIYQEPCFNDQVGKSKGELYWVIPKALQVSGSKVCLLINQKVAVALVYDDVSQSVKVEEFESCGESLRGNLK
jgi:hypothetical protein